MLEITKKLKSGLYNLSFIAGEIWPTIDKKSAKAKFHNKLHNSQGKHFTDDEIKKIKNILK